MPRAIDTAPLLKALKNVEGGLVDDPDDAGGITNHGMSLREAQKIGPEMDVDRDGDVDRDDIIALPLELAQNQFIKKWLIKPRFDELPEQIIPFMFDTSIHSGPSVATEFLQEVINQAGFGPIRKDGRCGDTTIMKSFAAQLEMGPFLVNALVEERLAFLWRLAKARPTYMKYMVRKDGSPGGFVMRVESFRVST